MGHATATSARGWSRYVLVTQDGDEHAEAPLATASTALDAFVQLVPDLRMVVSGHGQVVLAPDGTPLRHAAFAPGSDWILTGIDARGRHHAVLPTGIRRAGTHRDVWNRIPEAARRVAQRRWSEVDSLIDQTVRPAASRDR